MATKEFEAHIFNFIFYLQVEYLISWVGYDSNENSWQPKKHLSCPKKLAEFEASLKNNRVRNRSNQSETNQFPEFSLFCRITRLTKPKRKLELAGNMKIIKFRSQANKMRYFRCVPFSNLTCNSTFVLIIFRNLILLRSASKTIDSAKKKIKVFTFLFVCDNIRFFSGGNHKYCNCRIA